MKLNDLTKAELEAMSYDDIAYLILSEEKKETKITELFKKVCDLLGLSQAEYEAKITDFFQVLSTDQRFVMVDKGYWDLKSNHKANIIMDNDEEDEEEKEEDEEDEDTTEENDDLFYDEDSTDDDTTDDDLKDLVIITDDDEENANL